MLSGMKLKEFYAAKDSKASYLEKSSTKFAQMKMFWVAEMDEKGWTDNEWRKTKVPFRIGFGYFDSSFHVDWIYYHIETVYLWDFFFSEVQLLT